MESSEIADQNGRRNARDSIADIPRNRKETINVRNDFSRTLITVFEIDLQKTEQRTT
jgi:hypothetical protein